MKRILPVSLMMFFCAVSVAPGYYDAKLKSAFSSLYTGMHTCGGSAISNIGGSSGSVTNPSYGDEKGLLWMIAYSTSDHGAYFCPMFAVARNKDSNWTGLTGDIWTSYVKAGTNCFWLCKEGYGGNECASSASGGNACYPTKVNASVYSGIKAVAASGEIGVPGFGDSTGKWCSHWIAEEHNSALVISEWVPSGYGAIVKPVIFRTASNGTATDITSEMRVLDAGSTELLCKIGYKPNADKTDCVPVDANVCALAADNWCSGYSKTGYNATEHVLDIDGSCTKYKCSQAGYGFTSPTNQTCVPCNVTTARGGVSPANGVCIECKIGQYFNEQASNTGYCSEAVPVSKTVLKDGPDQTTTTTTDVSKLCWTMTDQKKYKSCVVGEVTNSPSGIRYLRSPMGFMSAKDAELLYQKAY